MTMRSALIVTFLVLCGLGSESLAQLPATRLEGVFPAGGNPGVTLDVTISGTDLDDAASLQFSHPGITAGQKMAEPGPFDEGPQVVPATFVVSIAGDVPAGRYEVRTRGKYGVSNPRTFEIGTLAETLETEPNNTAIEAEEIAAPLLVNGQINGGADVDAFRLPVTAGQRILIVCRAGQIDSPLDPVVSISDEAGALLAQSRQTQNAEAVIDLTAASSEVWTVQVTDALYRGGPQYGYRLTVGPLPYIEYVFPPAALPGTNGAFTLYGRQLPGGQPAGIDLDGRPLEKLDVSIPIPANVAELNPAGVPLSSEQFGVDFVPYQVTGPGGRSNFALVSAAGAPVVMEAGNDDPAQPQRLELPCEVAGQFYPQRDRDWFAFDGKQGDVVNIEVFSQRLGVPTDASLIIEQIVRDEAGEESATLIARVEDQLDRPGGHELDTRTTDPVYRFTAPADGTYRLMLLDRYSALRNDPRLTYRLLLRGDRPDFRLAASPADASGALFLRKGGRDSIRVVAFRQDGFDGDIRVSVTGLPEGVTSSEVLIGGKATSATLVLTAAENAGPVTGQLQVVGKAVIGEQEVTRTARAATAQAASPMMQPGQMLTSVPARMTSHMVVSVSELETAPVMLAAGNDQVWETARGGILKIPYTVVRRGEYKGNISGMPSDLPASVNAPQFNIDGNTTSGEFQLNMTAATPPGTYTVYVAGFAQGYQYRRNPEAAQAAAERKTRFEQIMADTAAKAKAAADEATKAQQELNTANTELTTANTKKTAADKAVTDLETALKNAIAAADTATKASADQPDDAALKTAATNAAQAVTDAEAKLKTAQEEQAAALKALEEAQTKQKLAEETKAKADAASQAATALAQEAQRLKQQADQQAQQKQNESNPQNRNLWAPSTPVTIKIAEYPVNVAGPPETSTVKQGEMLELAVQVTRLYGFDQPVNFQLILPGGVGGIGIQNLQVPNGQTEGKFTLNAQANATPGTHTLTLRTQMNWNGQNLQYDRPIELTVEEVKTP